jgi:hypothetical protein
MNLLEFRLQAAREAKNPREGGTPTENGILLVTCALIPLGPGF